MRLLKYLLLLLSLGCFMNLHAQGGILIFEISDAQNKPVSDLTIEVKKGDELYKKYVTNESGRVVDASIPSGKYSYSFNYGDLNTDAFEIKDGDYTWLNLDYRLWTISFKDDEDIPLEGKKATIYKVDKKRNETFVSEKFSNEVGVVEFLVPEGDYKYSTFRGSNFVTVKDENINTTVSVTSGEITHQTHFCFINDKKENLYVYAKDILVTHIAPDSLYAFGAVDAHSQTLSHGYYEYNTTENYVSCPAGTYSCSVETRDYGTIVDTFLVDENDPLTDNIVYLVLPTLPGGDKDDSTEVDKKPEIEIVDSITPGTPLKLKIIALLETDSTPIKDALTNLILSQDTSKRSEYFFTGDSGYVEVFVAPEIYNIAVLNDTMWNVDVQNDTSVTLYIHPKRVDKVYFDFYVGEKKFDPTSFNVINVWRMDTEDPYISVYGKWDAGTETYHYDDPLLLPYGEYVYSFFLDEKDYHKRFIKSFDVERDDTIQHLVTTLKPFYNVDIYINDLNGNSFESRQYIERWEAGYSSMLVTDSAGHYSEKIMTGEYTFVALGDTQFVNLVSDTVLYFQSKATITQKVKFQFLHDGQMVFPQIMNMNVKTSDGLLYAKTISHQLAEYEGKKNVWVFDEPTLCEANQYSLEYVLKDYDYNGTFNLDFTIQNPEKPDTMIYIVVPVKRSVTITIKDANLDLVTGVFGNIYKYGPDGVLSDSTEYDNGKHDGIRTNTSGQVIDHLVPGRYQLRILDIVRDFIVKDYDLEFEIISGTKMYDVKYIVLYESSKKPVENILLDVEKDSAFYNTTYTDENGTVELFCEAGNYSYSVHYTDGHAGSFKLSKDTTIYIYIEDPILIDSLSISACSCLPHNDSLRIEVAQSPSNATMKEVDWSVDNEVLAHITSEGVLVTNDVVTDGFVTVTVRSKDGGNVFTTKKFYVSNDNCGPDIRIGFTNSSETDMPLTSDSVALSAYFTGNDEFEHHFIYQYSKDSIQWNNMVGPTASANVSVPASQFTKDVYFRVLSSSTVDDVLRFAKDVDSSECGSNKVSNRIVLRINSLTPIAWPDSICSTQKEVSLKLDSAQLGNLAKGYELVWYKKTEGDDSFVSMELDNKTSISTEIDGTTIFKAAVQKDSVVSMSYMQTVFVERKPVFTLQASRDTACLNDTVSLSVRFSEGGASSCVWSNGGSDTTVWVAAQPDPYTVAVRSTYNVCPQQFDTISLVADLPVDFALSADRDEMCLTDTEGIVIKIDTLSSLLGSILWSDSSRADRLHVVPQRDDSFTAVVSSLYGQCPSMTKSFSIKVHVPLAVSINADVDDICQYGADTVVLTAQTLSGEASSYHWWNGLVTDTNTVSFVPEESVTPWVYISDGICADSDKDSIDVRVAKPSSVSISSSNKVFEYRSDINLNARTTSSVFGPYSWYSIDEDGDERLLDVTEADSMANMPSGDVTYYVRVLNGACPVIMSDSISLHLMDNIVIPTIFTPYTVDGENDDFMPGYPVIIYDRYGDIICNDDDGWDGYYKGELADPGVYYYVLTLKDGRTKKGTIELFRK